MSKIVSQGSWYVPKKLTKKTIRFIMSVCPAVCQLEIERYS